MVIIILVLGIDIPKVGIDVFALETVVPRRASRFPTSP